MRITLFSFIAGIFLVSAAWAGPAQDRSFLEAAEKGDLAAAQTSLKEGADINVKADVKDETALIKAAERGDEKMVQFLLSQKANVNLQDKFKATALMYAAAGGHLAIAESLIARGADLNLRDDFGKTALMDAAASGNSPILKMLLSNKIDVNVMDRFGKTAWVYAVEKGDPQAAEALLKKGAKERYEALQWTGEYSSYDLPQEAVIQTAAEWQDLWADLYKDRPLPSIDLERYVIVAIFLGAKPTGGYGVEFEKPRNEGKAQVIPYREVKPKGFVTQAFTQAFSVKVFKRKGSSIVLRKLPE